MPFTLRSDKELCPDGIVFDDHGAGTGQPTSILAMLAAVHECTVNDVQPFDWSSSDIISDRNSLRNLLRWVDDWEKLEDFRIDLHLAGNNSVVFTRWRRDTRQEPWEHSYGFSYEDDQTESPPGCEVSQRASHDRIVSYVSR
jgi:hypothetical protein